MKRASWKGVPLRRCLAHLSQSVELAWDLRRESPTRDAGQQARPPFRSAADRGRQVVPFIFLKGVFKFRKLKVSNNAEASKQHHTWTHPYRPPAPVSTPNQQDEQHETKQRKNCGNDYFLANDGDLKGGRKKSKMMLEQRWEKRILF